MTSQEQAALLTLLLTRGIGQTLLRRCVNRFGSAQATLQATPSDLARLRGVAPARAADLHHAIRDTRTRALAEEECVRIREAGVQLLVHGTPDYPTLLNPLADAPMLLWVRGRLLPDDALALGIVGSRRCSRYGREQAHRFAAHAAATGLCIVSGGAYGIDAAAHQAALQAGGRTLAVLGSGLANPYPAEHRELFDRIADGHGAVLSEHPMLSPPLREHFLPRNRIISGLALGILVIEAARRSGALSTARCCVEEHGRELMALPGPVDHPGSAGCHHLIRQGATLVSQPLEVLDCLEAAGHTRLPAAAPPPSAVPATTGDSAHAPTTPADHILTALQAPASLDQLLERTGLTAAVLTPELTRLEIRGHIRRQGSLFSRRSPAASGTN